MTKKEKEAREVFETYAKGLNDEPIAFEYNENSDHFGIIRTVSNDFKTWYHLIYFDFFWNVESLRAYESKREAYVAFYALIQNPNKIIEYPF